MSFFTGSSRFIITGGNFTSLNLPTQDPVATQVLRKIKEGDSCEFYAHGFRKRHQCSSRNSDGLMIVKTDEIEMHRELLSGNSYRIHAASHEGRLVAVKTFEGPRAKRDWTVDVAFFKTFLHSNLLKIVGVSDKSSKSYFVLFHGIKYGQKMQWLIAKALGTDLNRSVQLSMRAVKGIAAGLSYVRSQNIPIHSGTMNNNRKWGNFDIFIGYDNEPMISFHPSSSTIHEDGSVSQTFDIGTDSRGIEVLNGLCQQLFSAANSILYDDSPERKFNAYDRGLPAVTQDTEGTSDLPESETISNTSNPTERPKSKRTPRREVWWLDLGEANQSLESIKRCFEDFLARFLLSSSNILLPRITSPKDDNLKRNLHQCPGYLREEITLTSDVTKSAIVSHAFPSQSELCSICGQLVQYADSEPSVTDEEIEPSTGMTDQLKTLVTTLDETPPEPQRELSSTSTPTPIAPLPMPTPLSSRSPAQLPLSQMHPSSDAMSSQPPTPAPPTPSRSQTPIRSYATLVPPKPRRLSQPPPPRMMRATSEERTEAHERWLPPLFPEGDYDYNRSSKLKSSKPSSSPPLSHTQSKMSAPTLLHSYSPSARTHMPAPPVPALPRFSIPAPTSMMHRVQTPAPLVPPKPRRISQPSPPRTMRSISEEKAEAHERWLPPSFPEGDYCANQSSSKSPSAPPLSHTRSKRPAPRPLQPYGPSARTYTPSSVPALSRFSTPAPTNMTYQVQIPAPLVPPKPRRSSQLSPRKIMPSTSEERESYERWLPPSSPEDGVV